MRFLSYNNKTPIWGDCHHERPSLTARRRSAAEGLAGRQAELAPVGGAELAWAGPAPLAGHSGNRHPAGRVGGPQLLVGAREPDPAQIPGRGHAVMAAERGVA